MIKNKFFKIGKRSAFKRVGMKYSLTQQFTEEKNNWWLLVTHEITIIKHLEINVNPALYGME